MGGDWAPFSMLLFTTPFQASPAAGWMLGKKQADRQAGGGSRGRTVQEEAGRAEAQQLPPMEQSDGGEGARRRHA